MAPKCWKHCGADNSVTPWTASYLDKYTNPTREGSGLSQNILPPSPGLLDGARSRWANKLEAAQQATRQAVRPLCVIGGGRLVRQLVRSQTTLSALPLSDYVHAGRVADRVAGRELRSLQARSVNVHNLEVKPGETLAAKEAGHPLALLRENRVLCRKTADFLQKRADIHTRKAARKQATFLGAKDPLARAAWSIRNCSLSVALRSLSDDVNYKVGQALCRSRLCPNCQRVLSARRKSSFLEWFDLNRAALAPYRFYHLVLTVPHSLKKGIRTGVYTSQLLDYYAQLRGQGKGAGRNTAAKEWWEQRIAGGFTSVELAPGFTDRSAHIHLHILLIAKMPLIRADRASEFLKNIRSRWAKITGTDAKQVKKGIHLEPVYYLNDKGEKIYCRKDDDIDLLRKGVSECMKYTLKSDETSLEGYTDDFLRELLTTKNRYYGRFGCLTKKSPLSSQFVELDRLNQDFKDLEQIKKRELEQLYNPETGQVHKPENTSIAFTRISNLRAKFAPSSSKLNSKTGKGVPITEKVLRGDEKYFSLINRRKVVFYEPDEKQTVAKALAWSILSPYDSNDDLK